MNKATLSLVLAVVLAAAGPALARSRHAAHHPQPGYSAPVGKVNSGYYPPRTWDEIEISGPNSY